MPADPYAEYQQPLNVRSYGDTAQIQEEETPSDPYAKYQQPAESKGFLGNMWDEVKKGPANLLGVGNSINQAVMHPKQALESMGAGISDMAGKTAASFKRGDYKTAASQAVNTGLNAVVPGLGTSSEEAGEKLRSGDIAGGLGQTAGIGVNTALGAKTPQILKSAARTLPKPLNPEGSSLAGLTRANPRVAMTRALRPTPSDTSFNKNIPTTLANVKEANAGVSPRGNAEMLPAVDKAIASHQSVLDQWMQRAGGRPISGAPIVEATRKATEGMLPSEQGAAAAQIERAAADYGHNFTPQELKARLELLNKRIDSFASQAPGKQSAALADIPDAVLKAQRDVTADTLYRALDPEGQGAGPRLIQRQIGDMIGLKDAALRRSNAILAEQPVSPLGAAKDTLEKIPFVRNFVPGAAGATKGVNVSFSDSMKGRSDPLIRRSFDAVGKPNVPPRPGTDLYPMGDESRMLTAGDAIPPAPKDTSFVRGAPLDASQAAAVMPKALPPGSAPFTQGTAVPDVQGRPDMRAPYSRGLLEAPKPGQPPTNVQPRGPGSVRTPPYMPQEEGRPVPLEGTPPKRIAAPLEPAAPEALESAPAPKVGQGMKPAEPEAPQPLETKAAPSGPEFVEKIPAVRPGVQGGAFTVNRWPNGKYQVKHFDTGTNSTFGSNFDTLDEARATVEKWNQNAQGYAEAEKQSKQTRLQEEVNKARAENNKLKGVTKAAARSVAPQKPSLTVEPAAPEPIEKPQPVAVKTKPKAPAEPQAETPATSTEIGEQITRSGKKEITVRGLDSEGTGIKAITVKEGSNGWHVEDTFYKTPPGPGNPYGRQEKRPIGGTYTKKEALARAEAWLKGQPNPFEAIEKGQPIAEYKPENRPFKSTFTNGRHDGYAHGLVDGEQVWSDGHVAFKSKPPGQLSTSTNQPDMTKMWSGAVKDSRKELTPLGFHRKAGRTMVTFDDGTTIDAQFYDFAKKQYPKAVFKGKDARSAVTVWIPDAAGSKMVGAIMPMRADDLPPGIAALRK